MRAADAPCRSRSAGAGQPPQFVDSRGEFFADLRVRVLRGGVSTEAPGGVFARLRGVSSGSADLVRAVARDERLLPAADLALAAGFFGREDTEARRARGLGSVASVLSESLATSDDRSSAWGISGLMAPRKEGASPAGDFGAVRSEATG